MKRFAVFMTIMIFSHMVNAHGVVNLQEWVIVEGRNVNLVGEASTASQGVVGQEELELRPLSRTGEVLETIPGMVVTQHSGSGKANQYFLRGFNLDHGTDFATIVDGMPVNMRSHGHGQGYSDLNFVIPETIHNIQYQKGSYYADVGDFSGAGSANMEIATLAEKGVVELAAGDNQYSRLLLLDSWESVDTSVLYAFEWNGYDGPWTDIEENVRKTNGLVKLQRSFGDAKWEISAMAYDNSWNSADQIPDRAVDQGIIDELGSLDPTVGGSSSRYSLNSAWTRKNLAANVYFIKYDLQLWSNFTYFLDDETDGDQFQQVDERTIYGGRINYQWQQNLGALQLEHTIGGELRIDDIDEVGLYKTRARERMGVVRSDAVDETSIGAFWQTNIMFNPQWRVVVGARYDHYEFEVNPLADININGVDLTANGGVREDGIASFNGSMIYTISSDWETYLSVGQGFHSNDARGTTIRVDPSDGSEVTAVDPLVRSLGYEVGVRVFLNDRINTSLAIWQLDVDSELLFVGDAGTTEASRSSNRIGLEWTVYYRIDDTWAYDLEYAWTDAEFSDVSAEGKYIPGALRQVLQTGLSARFSNGWLAGLRLRHFGERPLIEDNSVKSDPSTTVNLRLAYEALRWGVNIDVLNAFDSNDHDIDYFYESRLQQEPSGVGVEDLHYHVLEPRSIRLAFEIHF